MKSYRFVLTVVVIASVLTSNAFAFGSIAVGDADPKALDASTEKHFVVSGHLSHDDAKTAAVKLCVAEGLFFCKAAAWYDACGAYAKSSKNSGTGYGASEEEAKRSALASCGSDCKVVVAQCEPEKSK